MHIVRYHRHGPGHHRAFRRELQQVQDHFFGHGTAARHDDSSAAGSQWKPRVDIREEATRFVIYTDLPGVDPQDIEVQMDKGILSIKGERKGRTGEDAEGWSRIERRHGSFHRRFALPDSADAEGITAHGHNGVLEVVIPKKPETTPRRVQVGSVPQAGGPTVQ